MWSALNRPDIDPDDPSYSDVRRRVLGRLGEYAALAIGPLNLRPTAAALLREDDQRVELRVSTPSSHVVLVIATDGDLAPEVFWLRALAASNLPIPRLIAHDLSLTTLPFAYALESYTGGSPLDWLEDGPRMRVLARQAGRTLRRSHQVAAPGYGRPALNGRWPAGILARRRSDSWLARRETLARAEEALGLECAAALIDATHRPPGAGLCAALRDPRRGRAGPRDRDCRRHHAAGGAYPAGRAGRRRPDCSTWRMGCCRATRRHFARACSRATARPAHSTPSRRGGCGGSACCCWPPIRSRTATRRRSRGCRTRSRRRCASWAEFPFTMPARRSSLRTPPARP